MSPNTIRMPSRADRKKVTIAPGSKGDTGLNRVNKKKEMKDPIQRQGKNIGTRDLKKTRNAYQEQMDQEKADRERETRELRARIEYLKRDSEKIVRNQQLKFGTTLDDLKTVKHDLEQAKAINDALLKEVEAKRTESDRLQNIMDEIVYKINSVMIEATDLNREKRIYELNAKKIEKTEEQCQRLVKNNQDLRSVLLKNHLDPTADAGAIQTPVQSPRTTEKKRESSLPVIYNNKNLVQEFRSLEDIHRRGKKGQRQVFRKASLPASTEKVYRVPNFRSLSNVLPRLPQEIRVNV